MRWHQMTLLDIENLHKKKSIDQRPIDDPVLQSLVHYLSEYSSTHTCEEKRDKPLTQNSSNLILWVIDILWCS